jgi:hypothetical protein
MTLPTNILVPTAFSPTTDRALDSRVQPGSLAEGIVRMAPLLAVGTKRVAP